MISPPTISIIMPAYNCGKYLRAAVDSMLHQTFSDFEFIIINDGSTDDTEQIILSYADNRIRYKKNEVNMGLIYTLNKGVSEAKGTYIARMDGDDISLPERLEKQLEYLQKNEAIDVLATQVSLIDEQGKNIGFWDEDVRHTTITTIKNYLPINNCIAHPTVMGKTTTFLRYRYDASQKLSEDYDLWLRVAAGGGVIDKLPLPLLQHRILQTSFTRTRKVNVFYKLFWVKWTFIKNQLLQRRFNKFIYRTIVYSLVDYLKGTAKAIKKLVTRQMAGPVSICFL